MTSRDTSPGSARGGRWCEALRLFEQALDRPAAKRTAFVRSLVPEDPWLVEAVLELLELDAGSSPLDQPLRRCAELAAAEPVLEEGNVLGRYRLLERIGGGAMGSVFRAERITGGVRQQVAVKVLRWGLDADSRRRFLQEQRIMAALDHPWIARFLDIVSTPSGAACLVMELVDGTPITEYADRHRLSVEDRIRLVVHVCSAVCYAHRRLVVHRDLKPANVLVTEGGQVRLIDFGIAKILDPDEHLEGAATRTGVGVMTPSYASPEQLFGRPITTGTDIWALGVLLFELLTGGRPFEWVDMSPTEIERRLELSPPPKASASLPEPGAGGREIARRRGLEPDRLRRRLRGDLDQVIGRALAFRREQQYDSAAALAADLVRHLLGQPVTARRHSMRHGPASSSDGMPWPRSRRF